MTFKQKCEKAAEEVGVDVTFYNERSKEPDAFEDDGALHVTTKTMRACFRVSYGDDRIDQNIKTKRLMTLLGREVSYRVLVDEVNNSCPTCGCDCGNW